MVSGAGSFDVLEQFAGDQVVHVTAEIGRVQSDRTVHILEEKHDG